MIGICKSFITITIIVTLFFRIFAEYFHNNIVLNFNYGTYNTKKL